MPVIYLLNEKNLLLQFLPFGKITDFDFVKSQKITKKKLTFIGILCNTWL